MDGSYQIEGLLSAPAALLIARQDNCINWWELIGHQPKISKTQLKDDVP